VAKVLAEFRFDVEQRRAQQRIGLSLTTVQKYALRELRVFSTTLGDKPDLAAQVTTLEKAFTLPLSKAVRSQLAVMRRNGVTGESLLHGLTEIYHSHALNERRERPRPRRRRDRRARRRGAAPRGPRALRRLPRATVP